MFITIETNEGSASIINTAQITHVTMSDPNYAQEGSVIHFASDRALHVKGEIEDMLALLEGARVRPSPSEAMLMFPPAT